MEGQNLNKFILGIVIVGITLILGIYIAATLQSGFRIANTAGAYINESVVRPSTAGITLAAANLRDGSCGAITAIYNGTVDGTLIPATNYTQTGCTVVNSTQNVIWNTAWLVNYPYTWTADTVSSNVSGNLTDALSGGAAWITILVVVGFAIIVLGMLTSGLSRAGGSSGTYEQEEPIY